MTTTMTTAMTTDHSTQNSGVKKRNVQDCVDLEEETVMKTKKTRLWMTFDENGAYIQKIEGDDVIFKKLHKDNEEIIRNIIAFHPTHLTSIFTQGGFIMHSGMFINIKEQIQIPMPDIVPSNFPYITVKNVQHLLMVVFNRIQEMFESLSELPTVKKDVIKKIVKFHNDTLIDNDVIVPLREGRSRFYCLACGSSPVCSLPCMHMWQAKTRKCEKQYCFNCLISSKLTLISFFDNSQFESMSQRRKRTPAKVFCDCDSSAAFMHYNLLMAISYNQLYFAPLIFRAALSDAIKVSLLKTRSALFPPKPPNMHEVTKHQFNMFGTLIAKHVSNCDASRDIYMFIIDNLGNIMDGDCKKQQKVFNEQIENKTRKKQCMVCQESLTIEHIFKYFHNNTSYEQRVF